MLALRPGHAERRAYDYFRAGTTTLFAALHTATGDVVGKCFKRHRAVEFRPFLDEIDRSVPEKLEVHLILDNYATHKTPLIHHWFVKRPRFHLHFTATSSSWLNLVERAFAELAEKHIKRGSRRSTKELEDAIYAWIDGRNEDPKPFKWTKTSDEILEYVARYCRRTSNAVHYRDRN